jgi:hypothetical protein
MDDLTLVARLRDDLPAGADLTGPQRRLAAEIATAVAAPAASGAPAAPGRPGRQYRRPLVVAGTIAAAAAVAVAVVQAQPATPAGRTSGQAVRPGPPVPSVPRPAATAAELVAYATRAAAVRPAFNPKPHQWIYRRELYPRLSQPQALPIGPPYQLLKFQHWTRVDDQLQASIRDGKLVVDNPGNQGAELGGWPGIGIPANYAYLDSLPASSPKLKRIIAANNHVSPRTVRGGRTIFDAIRALMDNDVLSPRLNATLYGVLATLPGVRFDRSVTDLAGRHDLAFTVIENGWAKSEILISPTTYAYLGQQLTANRAYTSVASDGTQHYRKGQLLGWQAVLAAGIVQHAGQVPRQQS